MEKNTLNFENFTEGVYSLVALMVSHIYYAIKDSNRQVGRFEGVEVRDTEIEYPMDVVFIGDNNDVMVASYDSKGDIDFSNCGYLDNFMDIEKLAILADHIEEIVADNADVNLRYNYDVVEDDYSENADA